MENVVMVLFEVESEAYQALAELKRDPVNEMYTIPQMGLVQKQGGRIVPCEGFDSGADTMDDTIKGSLIGGLVGIFGGPIGVLFSGSVGALVGSMIDLDDTQKNLSMLECVSRKMQEGQVGLVVLIQENDESYFERRAAKFKTEILRWDAAVIAEEVEEAEKMEREMQKEAKERLNRKKKEEFRKDLEERRSRIHADLEAFKEKFKKA